MPVSGSMDQYAHRTANLLLGNDQNDPVLELTIMGGTYEFH
ncbi:biotin-dependent carboxyltransferase family protein, partial [Aduncisulcus paluster]